ncbi:MAG: hypothetical protein CUN52_01970 [Phototrophicales bacterium]|nr:MAG: hypothetical protein CUN52_01970 [Phototrophicales bacterium]
MRRVWIMSICLWLISSMASAQGTDLPTVQVVYQSAMGTGAVSVYRESENTSTPILGAENIPQNSFVEAFLSPDGRHVAITVSQVIDMYTFGDEQNGKTIGELGYQNVLYVFNLINGEMILRYDLLPTEYRITPHERDAMLEAYFGVVWSPNSDGLVFVRGTTGPIDEYTPNGYGHVVYFNIATRGLVDLPEIGGTPYDWRWSNTGQYAVYRGIEDFGTGAGYASSGAYVVDMRDIANIRQKPMVACCQDIVPLGWLETGEFVYSYFNIMAGAAGLFAYTPQTDSTQTILPAGQDNLEYSLALHAPTGKILVPVYDFPATEPILTPGLYVYESITQAQPKRISDMFGMPTFFVDANTIYINDYDMPMIYRIDTGDFIPDTVVTGFVYPSGYGALFTEDETEAMMYFINDAGEWVIIPNIIPNDLLSYLRFVDTPTSVYFIAFVTPNYMDDSGWHMVYVGSLSTGTSKQVSLTVGDYVLDVGLED